MDYVDRVAKLQQINFTFRPSAPIDDRTLFAGRRTQVDDALGAIFQAGRHAIIFGERGVGKTSLVKFVHQTILEQMNHPECGTINCDATMDFSAIWRTACRELHVSGDETLDTALPDMVMPDDVRYALQDLKKTVFIFDEFDQITDPGVAPLMAATIKNLSDHAIDATIILVGVADSVDALIAEHRSIERALAQIKMPRMSKEELFEIIEKGLRRLKMTIDDEAKAHIANLSQGLPHYTHTLALYAAESSVNRDSLHITLVDVRAAIQRALSQTQQSVRAAYDQAVLSAKQRPYAEFLLGCAMADTDEVGFFTSLGMKTAMTTIHGNDRAAEACDEYLVEFCDAARGPVIRRYGSPELGYRYRFENPLMQPFVIMRALNLAQIVEEQLDKKG